LKPLSLLPYPQSVERTGGVFQLPHRCALHLDAALDRDRVMLPVAERLQLSAAEAGTDLELITGEPKHPRLAIRAFPSTAAPAEIDGYLLRIHAKGVELHYRDEGGLHAGIATLRQLLREHGRRLPRLVIGDFAHFGKRGVMLDISRGRVPNLNTLLELVEHLADFKINELQLYTEHTFAYRNYEPVWRGWGPLTAEEVMRLDRRCRQLGIELTPNQNSFGHLRYWLEHPPKRPLAEVDRPYASPDGTYVRYPSTLAPGHPGTLPFLRELYDELLPCFSSDRFNVGCDETWDLGRGQSRALAQRIGKGRVYVDFLKKIHAEVESRGKQMLFWGDIILHYPELLRELPKNVVALNWGYEAKHPFESEGRTFAQSGLPFYVCPGTSSWMTLIGRHDNAFANLTAAAEAGRKHGAIGYLNTDWGDGGHPQPLAVSYLPYIFGAALSWSGACTENLDRVPLLRALSRDIFGDASGRLARCALELGLAHRHFNYYAFNITPFGCVIAAPRPRDREIFCREGLRLYARIERDRIQDALGAVEDQRAILARIQFNQRQGDLLRLELDLAARMAEESCRIMLWQQALAAGRKSEAAKLARQGVRRLREIDRDYDSYWPLRNKGTTAKSSGFLKWRMEEYRRGRLAFPPEVALATPESKPDTDV
jgi:hexosaminidase